MSDTKMTIKSEKLEVVGAQSWEKHEDITYQALPWNLNSENNVMTDLPLSINLLSYWNEIFDKGGGSW